MSVGLKGNQKETVAVLGVPAKNSSKPTCSKRSSLGFAWAPGIVTGIDAMKGFGLSGIDSGEVRPWETKPSDSKVQVHNSVAPDGTWKKLGIGD